MATRKSEALWEGKLQTGKGTMKLGSGAFTGNYSFDSRFKEGKGTNPEELIAAAHAGCFSMAFAHILEEEGYVPEQIHTIANVSIEKMGDGFRITKIKLETEGRVWEIDEEDFQRLAEQAKNDCPVSKLLSGADISLDARLVKNEALSI